MSLGYCPKCGADGILREKRLYGNDTCENGHVYPSNSAVIIHPECREIRRIPNEEITFNPSNEFDVDCLLEKYGPEGLYELGELLKQVAIVDMDQAIENTEQIIRNMNNEVL